MFLPVQGRRPVAVVREYRQRTAPSVQPVLPARAFAGRRPLSRSADRGARTQGPDRAGAQGILRASALDARTRRAKARRRLKPAPQNLRINGRPGPAPLAARAGPGCPIIVTD